MKHYIRRTMIIYANEGNSRGVVKFQAVNYRFLQGAITAAVDIEIQERRLASNKTAVYGCEDRVLGIGCGRSNW